jgi:LysM repeat protein
MITDFGPALRTDRRRRWQRNPRVVVAGTVAAIAGSVLLGGNVYGALSTGQPSQVQVHRGDSIWSIAAAHYQAGDVRDHVDQIITLNHLDGGAITPGQTLLLPAN